MTDLSKSDARTFFGITIEGDVHEERARVEQRPLSDLKPYFDKLWANGILAVTWSQYTPWFNDGDTCEFGVNSPAFTANPKVVEAWLNESYEWEDDNGDYQDAHIYDYERPWSESYPHPDGLTKDICDLPVDSAKFEYALLDTFGNHTQIVVTPNRVVQWEYSHD